MEDSSEPDITNQQVYNVAGFGRLRGYLLIAGGILLAMVSIVQFLLLLRVRSNAIQIQLSCTLPMMGALACFFAAWRSFRSPVSVSLNDNGLEIRKRNLSVEHWPWDQVTFAKAGSPTLSNRRQITIYGNRGQILTKLSQDFEDFDSMLVSISKYMSDQTSPFSLDVKTKKARKRGIGLMAGGVFFLALAAANFWIVESEIHDHRLLAEKGKTMTAVVTSKRIAPDGHTRRLCYRVINTASPVPESNIEVIPQIWEILQPGMQIDVLAVPDDPAISKLPLGQVDDSMSPQPGGMLLACAGISIFAIISFVAGYLGYRGKEISLAGMRLRIRPMS